MNIDLFNKFEIIDLYRAYYDCRKNKRNTKVAIEFEIELEKNLQELYLDIVNSNYQIGKSICFITTYPKVREIFAWNFRDRIVHHLLYNKLNRLFEKGFVYDSCASQKWKWVLFAQNRLYKHTQRASNNFTRKVYYLQMDIKNFFTSIDKNILEKLLGKKIPKGLYLNLLLQVLWHSPTENFYYKWDKNLYTKVKKSKSLFFTSKEKWLAIWNLTSQFFANIYLNELDNFVKRTLKCRYYVRYVDDFVLLSTDKEELKIFREQIKYFLQEKLLLIAHPNKIIMQEISQWINFVWAVIKPYHRYLRNRTYWNLQKKIDELSLVTNFKTKEALKIKLSQLNSYMWFMKHTNYKKRFIKLYNKNKIVLNKYFTLNLDRMIFVLRE